MKNVNEIDNEIVIEIDNEIDNDNFCNPYKTEVL